MNTRSISFRVSFFALLLSAAAFGQTYYPLYTPGDAYYYVGDPTPIHTPTITWHKYLLTDTTFNVNANFASDCCVPAVAHFSKVGFDTANGFVILEEGRGKYAGLKFPWIPHPAFVQDRMEYIHNVRPQLVGPDTMTFTRYWSADTTILGISVRVHYFMVDSGQRVNYLDESRYFRYLAVADTFGLVWFVNWEGTRGSLVNATIRGANYNVSGTYVNTLPLQIGNEWHYAVGAFPWNKESVQYIDRDTVMNSLRYFHFMKKERVVGGLFIDPPTELWLRVDTLQGIVYSGVNNSIYTRYITRFGEGFIDTGRIGYCSDERKVGRYYWFGYPTEEVKTWMDGIGLLSHFLNDGSVSYYPEQLFYSKINGVECGTPLAIDEPTESPFSFALGQNYPNPVSLSAPVTNIPIRAAHGEVTQLVLTDALGREMRRMETGSEQNTVTLNVQGLPPGVYWYRAGSDTEAKVQKLVVVP